MTAAMATAARLSVWGLAGVSISALLLTRELGVLRVILISGVFGMLFLADRRNALRDTPRLETGLVLAAFAASLFRFLFLDESFLLLVADFLVAFLLIKCAFAKDHAD